MPCCCPVMSGIVMNTNDSASIQCRHARTSMLKYRQPAEASAVQQMIDISYPLGPQQQTRRMLLQRANGTNRRTDTTPLHRPCGILCEQCRFMSRSCMLHLQLDVSPLVTAVFLQPLSNRTLPLSAHWSASLPAESVLPM